MFEELDYFLWSISLLASFLFVCVLIAKAIIMKFLEDRDVSILYLSTKFELDRFTNIVDLLSDRKPGNINTQTFRLKLILFPYII